MAIHQAADSTSVYFVACSALVFLFTTTLGFITIGLVNSGIIAGKPLGLLHAGIYGLDPAVFVDVEELSANARRQLPWLAMGSRIPLVGVVIISGMLLYQYSIWVFQSINQLMRVRLIDQLQMQSLADSGLPPARCRLLVRHNDDNGFGLCRRDYRAGREDQTDGAPVVVRAR